MSDGSAPSEPSSETVHASCIAMDGKGLLILGKSGAGKSGLALQMMAFGAKLVSDDRTVLSRVENRVIGAAPHSIEGLIEARGVGVLQAETAGPTEIALAVDLDQPETERLPRVHLARILGCEIPCLHKIDAAHFPAAILQYLKGSRRNPS